mmetsp:Transcript_5301/g.9544  ORF Transcript_5301/g.9544 Transcript_5301/m.9544 type:complete len:225 (-) Transcript_5301:297-971(-)
MVVGLAVWPWVRLSMGTSANSFAMAASSVMICSIIGSTSPVTASRSCSAWLRLLMSSEVHAKWVNSNTLLSSSFAANLSFSTYSTAFTSWLVVRSTSFTACASSTLQLLARSSRKAFVASLKGGTSSTSGSSDSICSHRISTVARALMRPNSEAVARRPDTFPPYRPSIGPIAVSSDSSSLPLATPLAAAFSALIAATTVEGRAARGCACCLGFKVRRSEARRC